MAFKVVKQLSAIEWPVKVLEPVDGGKTQEHEFTAKFKPVNEAEYKDLQARCKSDVEFLKQLIVGWEGLQDETGTDIPYDPDFIADLIAFPFVRSAILRAYQNMQTGIATKN